MKLLELRKQKKLSQAEIAVFLQTSQKTYSNYENENTEPDIATLCKLADYYGVSLDYLCEHESRALELPSNLSQDDKQTIFAYLALPELKKAVIRGEIKALAII